MIKTSNKPSRTASHYLFLCTMAMIAIVTISCSDSSNWYPEGTASIASVYETVAPEKTCVCTIVITNTGVSKILRSTISITIITNLRKYYATVVSDTGILSGGKIYTTVSIPYFTDTETIITDKSQVINSFFE